MFQHFKNIDTAFRHVRLFTLVIIICSLCTCCYTIYWSYKQVFIAQERVYIIANGKAILATGSSRQDNLLIEARHHVELFHQYFFNLLPDEKAIERNIIKALYLADHSAKQQYDDLKEEGFYNRVISSNVTQEVITDSIVVNMQGHPYHFRFYGKLRIVRPTTIAIRNLLTEGYLRDLKVRSEDNTNAFLIEKWVVILNNDLETIKR